MRVCVQGAQRHVWALPFSPSLQGAEQTRWMCKQPLWVRGKYKPGRLVSRQEREESQLQERMRPQNTCYLSQFLGVPVGSEWLTYLQLKRAVFLAQGLLVPGAVHQPRSWNKSQTAMTSSRRCAHTRTLYKDHPSSLGQGNVLTGISWSAASEHAGPRPKPLLN